MTLRYLSLFSGIGGMDLGFDRAGMVCAGQVEIDDYCRRVLAKHWPGVPRMNDVREVQGDEFGAVDLICGGFPCQPHSVAGQRRGAADDRDLWPEMRRLVAAIRPAWVVGENVLGIRSTILDAVLSDLETLGYSATALIVPACALDAPHRRDRVWILAHRNSHRHARSSAGHAAPNQKRNGSARQQARNNELYVAIAGSENVPYADEKRWDGRAGELRPEWRREPENGGRWQPEPGICRVANGIPAWMDRIKGLGNAVVPQVAEWLGRHIVAAEMETNQ